MKDIENVAPLAGAWIEISQYREDVRQIAVAPLAGAWIEIFGLFCRCGC